MPSVPVGQTINNMTLNGHRILEHLDELGAQALVAFGMNNINTTLIFIAEDEATGEKVVVLFKNGDVITDPYTMGQLGLHTGNKVADFARGQF